MSGHFTDSLPIAYSYIRFSDPHQKEGDSLRRQTAKTIEWCERNGFQLDASLSLRDAGVSAFRGKHRSDKFALGQFLKLVERGRVPRGSYLVIENLDRLSREEERPALRLWMDILDAGINIVQLVPETVFRHEKSDMVDIMRAIIELSRGHSESRMKSERLSGVWSERKRRAREEGETLTHALPGWIEVRDGKRVAKPKAVAAIKRLFQLLAQGYGHTRAIRRLTKEGHQPFGCSHRKKLKKPPRWTKTYVFDLLKDRRLLGEFQPRIKATGEPDGEVILNYFPEVLTPAEFYAARRGSDGRKCERRDAKPVELQAIDELHQQGKTVAEIARHLAVNRQTVYRALVKLGRREQSTTTQERAVYPFAGMIEAAGDQGRYGLATWQSAGRHLKMLVSEDAKNCFPYFVFEDAVLSELIEIKPKEILEGANGHDEVTALQTEFDTIEAEIAEMNGFMDANGFSVTLGKRVTAAEKRLAEIAPRLEAAKLKASNPLSASWGEAQTLAKLARKARDNNDSDTLLRLRAALRRIIESIQLVTVRRGRDRVAVVQAWFAGSGQHRDYAVVYRPPLANAHKHIGAGCWHGALKFPESGKVDLRTREGAAKVEKLLTVVPVDELIAELEDLGRK